MDRTSQLPPTPSRPGTPTPPYPRPIPASRDRLQSRILVLFATALLLASTGRRLFLMLYATSRPAWWPLTLVISLLFAAAAWKLRAATAPAALLGGLISLALIFGQGTATLHRNVYPALITLFLVTHIATRTGRRRKEASGLAEPRSGRRASQVAANLCIAALCASGSSLAWFAASLAALAEATADTVSSETGQAFPGPTWLITSGRRVSPGIDGGISLSGTAAGLLSIAGILLSIVFTQALPARTAFAVALAATAGLLFDSLLGATLERRGWLGNDLVNLSSTLFSAALAYILAAR